MSKDLECPYCKYGMEVCHDDGFGCSESENHEMECRGCGKYFVFTTGIIFHYSPEKADCLNGSPHKLKETRVHPRRFSKMRCQDCDYEEPVSDARKAELIELESKAGYNV